MVKTFHLTSFLALFSLLPVRGMDLVGVPAWINDFEFHSTCRDINNEVYFQDVVFRCTHKKPQNFILTNQENFPRLDLGDDQSCQSYFQRLSEYVKKLQAVRREYMYDATVGGLKIGCAKMPSPQLPLPCALDTLQVEENYDTKRLDLTFLSIRVGTEENGIVLDVTEEFQEAFGTVSLTLLPKTKEDQSNFEKIVSTTHDLKGRVFEAIGSIENFLIPLIPEIKGYEKYREERRTVCEKRPTLFKNAIASLIFSPQDENELIILGPENEDSLLESALPSSISSYESVMEEEELDYDLDLYRYFKRVGDKRQVISPYLYYDDRTLFLTQTFEQDCLLFRNGKTQEGEIFMLRYTRAIPSSVDATDFSPKRKGLYQLEGNYWILLNEFYEGREAYLNNGHAPLPPMIFSQPEAEDHTGEIPLLNTSNDMQLQGVPSWINDFEFRTACYDPITKEVFPDVAFICADETPRNFILINPGNFPPLDLRDDQSCQSYFQRLSDYVERLEAVRREYMYGATVDDQIIQCAKVRSTQLPIPCSLATLQVKENYDTKRLDLTLLSIRVGAGEEVDVTEKFQEAFGTVSLEPAKTEGQSYFRQIVSTTQDLKGQVFEAIGAIETFIIPPIPGIEGYETEAPREERRITYKKGPNLYENAIASLIFSPQAENKLIILGPADEGSLPEPAASSSFLTSEESAIKGEELVHNLDLHRHFKLVGHERRAISPYLYNNGRALFLTQTFEQDCRPFVNGKTQKGEIFTLRYTRATPYPVYAPGFSPAERSKGIYQLEGKSWVLLNGFYKAQYLFPAQCVTHHGLLTQTILSQPETYDLKSTLERVGPLHGFVELTGQQKFAQLVDQSKDSTRGILRTIGGVNEEEDHVIVPYLLTIRKRPDLEVPDLMDHTAYDKQENHNKCAWNFCNDSSKEPGYSKLPLREKLKDPHSGLQIFSMLSLKLLPLLNLNDQRQFEPDSTLSLVLYHPDSTLNHFISFGSSVKIYAYMAKFLGLDELKNFHYYIPWNFEEDRELTIQPLAHCLRSLRTLQTIHFPEMIGIKNYEYLIDHGLCPNRSITCLSIMVRGDYPIALLGRLVAKNTTLKRLTIHARYPTDVSDYECFNELGRGLMKNKTLEKLTLHVDPFDNNCIYSDWQDVSGVMTVAGVCHTMVRRPLPHRPQGFTTCDFTDFEKGLRESNVNDIFAMLTDSRPRNRYHNGFESQVALRNMLKSLEKPNLRKFIG